jgi:hypothetical protein
MRTLHFGKEKLLLFHQQILFRIFFYIAYGTYQRWDSIVSNSKVEFNYSNIHITYPSHPHLASPVTLPTQTSSHTPSPTPSPSLWKIYSSIVYDPLYSRKRIEMSEMYIFHQRMIFYLNKTKPFILYRCIYTL